MQQPCVYCKEPISLEDPTCLRCGKQLLIEGRFRLVRLLGQGGMGAVYSALDRSTNQEVAVKFLLLSATRDWKTQELFSRSSKVLLGLDHPGLPKVYCFGETPDGGLYLVREAFSGGTLEERVQEQRLSPEVFRQLFMDLLAILQYLHSRVPPVLHRDIKPSNIMFRAKDDWRPVLVDFDVVAAPGPQEQRLTIVGTPGYTSPEQFAGQATTTSDLYSLGATMLFVATATHPDALPRNNGRFAIEPLLGGLGASTRRVLLRLLEPNTQDRFSSAESALAALTAPTNAAPTHIRPVASSPLRYGLLLPLLLLPLFWFFVGRQTKPAEVQTPTCIGSLADCDGDAKNSCETDLSSDKESCGACGDRCSPGERCVSSRCTPILLKCGPTTEDCDGRAENGCEVDLLDDKENCGGCGVRCSSDERCISRQCVHDPAKLRCETSLADCDKNPSNGCETNLIEDESNCGGCGEVCSDNERCSSKGCVSGEKLDDSYVASLCDGYLGCYKESEAFGAISGKISFKLGADGAISGVKVSGGAPAVVKSCIQKIISRKKIEDFAGAPGEAFFVYSGSYTGGVSMISERWGFRRKGDTRPVPDTPK